MNSTISKTFYTCFAESLFLRYKNISKKVVELGSFLQYLMHIFLGVDGGFWKINLRFFVKSFYEKLSSEVCLVRQHHIPQNISFWKLWVIIGPLPCWLQDSLLLTGPEIYWQIYHRNPCPVVLIWKSV